MIDLSDVKSEDALPHYDDYKALSSALSAFAPHDGGFDIADGLLHIVRSTEVQSETTCVLSQPSICIVPQGAKQVTLADTTFEYDYRKMVVYSAAVPISIRVTQASKQAPYFCLVIPLQPEALHRLSAKVFPDGVPERKSTRAVYVRDATAGIVSAANRMFSILAAQTDADLLVPHCIDEILIRLLRSKMGPEVLQIAQADSAIRKVSKAISWINSHFEQPLSIDSLASLAGMSVSAFHSHFKAVTALSPLQFQKRLRLQHARTLLREGRSGVTTSALEVGYTSASQFSREYFREFGHPPSQELP